MAKVSGPERGGRRDESPGDLPDVTPPRYAQPGHDFTLQSVIEMQRSLGELIAKVDRLVSDVASQGDKIDKVRMRLAWVAGVAAALGVIGTILIGLIKTIPWDKLG